MEAHGTPASQTPDSWLHPPEETSGLTHYVQTLRERAWLVVGVVVITTAFAVLYVTTATKTYEAQSQLVISPSSNDDSTLSGLPLIRESVDPTRPVETASLFVTSVEVAERVADALNIDGDPEDLIDNIKAEPVAGSNLVAITASAETATDARDLANAFAEETVAGQTEDLRVEVRSLLDTLGPSGSSSTLERLRLLEASDSHPNLKVETLARTQEAPVSPRLLTSILGGVFAGLVLGIVGAFGAQILDPRLRREEQLRRSYNLPILARIPKDSGDDKPLTPGVLSPATTEAYRTLRGAMTATRSKDQSTTILVTGSTSGEGKTTTAINLAASLAGAGNSVILVEADLRRPSIASTLDIDPHPGVVSVLMDSVALGDALRTTHEFGPNLGLLLADYEGGWISELFSLPGAKDMLEEARELADYMIIDSPPLTDVVDALPLARQVDDILVVTRLGRTDLTRLNQLAELLADNGLKPTGFTLVGAPRPKRSEYHYYRTTGSETQLARRSISRRGGSN